jgi:hypothetical protein
MSLTFTTNITNGGFTMEVLAEGATAGGRLWRHLYRTPAPCLSNPAPTRPDESAVLAMVKRRAEIDFRMAAATMLGAGAELGD